jgi:hypothetical protein
MATGNTLAAFPALANEPPSSSAAAFDVRNGQPHLAFDAGTNESAIFSGVLPDHYAAGGITVTLIWRAATAITGTVRWQVAFERQDDEGLDTDTDSFATAVEVTAAAPTTAAGQVQYTAVAFLNSEIDGLLKNERYRLKVTREADDATNDTMAGDAQLLHVLVRET